MLSREQQLRHRAGGEQSQTEESDQGAEARTDQGQNALVREGGPVIDVLGDNTTNAAILVMALIAWVAQYAVVSRCTC